MFMIDYREIRQRREPALAACLPSQLTNSEKNMGEYERGNSKVSEP